MLYSNFSSLKNSSSYFRWDDFSMNKSFKKAKLRSIVPTPSSLLIEVIEPDQTTEISKYAVLFTERQPFDISNMEDNSPVIGGRRKIPSEFSSGSQLPGISKRTEDIFIREDENGTRSHYCPLDSELDGASKESENTSDQPMSFDYDIKKALSNYSMNSEEIFLLAEKRQSSESEDSENSSIDSDTCMKYTPLENHPATIEKDPIYPTKRFLSLFRDTVKRPSYARLDEETMARWEKDSDDEMQLYDPYMNDTSLVEKCNIDNESDMEEFEKDSEDETKFENLNILSQNKNENDKEDLSTDTKPSTPKLEIEDKSKDEEVHSENPSKNDSISNSESNDINQMNNDVDKTNINYNSQAECTDKTEKSEGNLHSDYVTKDLQCASNIENGLSSNLNSEDDNENTKEKFESNSRNDCASKDIHYDDNDSKNKLSTSLNSLDENKKKKENFRNDLENYFKEKNLNYVNNEDVNEPISNINTQDVNEIKKESTEREVENNFITKKTADNEQKEKCMPEIKNDSNKTGDTLSTRQTEISTKSKIKEKKDSLILKPDEINISKSTKKNKSQTDYEDELHSGRMRRKSVDNKKSVKEKNLDLDNDGLILTDLPVLKPVGNSGMFEPVLVEEQRVASRPRNKVMKFFQTFKKKLERNKKA